ncbi:PorP/SprF family type IX secretion system membrane protein [Robertkochia sediminum]|uniref:PorP/SprF family type IX secretion system membrane protein n=1 Tax=Robertkochia sediminum TaxID=2785326 RepID=UPI001931F98B|nr:PorP/SprF family type IX secretion system membrane protein [Robertkochia sediminum]MBL7473424.1 PorP/SprF family type IX secretion system membrane protein [Robertkochia sediminum]
MKKVQIILALLVCSFAISLHAQTENTSTVLDWRQHNLNKYNRMLVNPAYSIAGEENRAISFWSRIQWTGVNNSPQTFLLNYSGKIGPSSGGGLGLYQQNLGLLTDSGILMNYAYEVTLGSQAALTLGINSTFFRRGLNKNAVNSASPDPTVLENQDDFLWLFMPGLNLRLGGFDLGFYAENLFDYNLNESRTVTGFESKIYSGQLAFTHTFKNAYGVFGGATLRNLAYVKTLPNNETQYGGSSMIDLSRFGWLQMGYNNVYGINGAVGVKLGDGLSIGVIYERGTNLSGQNFGPTYEAIATIELGGRNTVKRFVEVPEPKPQVITKAANEAIAKAADEVPAVETPSANKVVHSGKYTVYGGKAVPEMNAETKKEEEATLAVIQSPQKEAILDRVVRDMTEEEELLACNTSEYNKEEAPAVIVPQKRSLPSTGGPRETQERETLVLNDKATEYIEKETAQLNKKPVVTREVLGKAEGYKTMPAVQGIDKGFYLVVNVFSQDRYFKEFTSNLRNRGFEPQYFVNPDNDLWYVYLAYADNYYQVKQLQRSHVQGKYRDDKWVLWIK